MFHKNLDQASKRYKEHPNVAAMYTSLPRSKSNRAEQNPSEYYLPKVRDFAYDQHGSEIINTRAFIANFAHCGFRSRHRRVNSGDLLSKAGVLGYEKRKPLQEPSADLKARFPGFFDMKYFPPPQPQKKRSTMDTTTTTTTVKSSVSSDLSGTTDTPSVATTSATTDPAEGDNDTRRPHCIRDDPLMLAVAVCMLEYMKRGRRGLDVVLRRS
ncbi:MAG: hypothetical protein ALECFALPRED_002011 [Alectoria fallacina]|uniref:Uncharacterized protein n=1 Tax=Alectoria fallacina TaxID=1903189 RepID=A0A8H3IBN2_9LECA|nr:MAG: hypothetical protein ALECFALPRED_002011 [Alectoria fallacina]